MLLPRVRAGFWMAGGAGGASRNVLRARSASGSVGTPCGEPESSGSALSGAFDGTKLTGGRPGIDGGSGGLRRVGRVSGSKWDSSGPVQPSSLRKVSSGSGTPESPPELTHGNFERAQVSTTTGPACMIRPQSARNDGVANSRGKPRSAQAPGANRSRPGRCGTLAAPHRTRHSKLARGGFLTSRKTISQLQ